MRGSNAGMAASYCARGGLRFALPSGYGGWRPNKENIMAQGLGFGMAIGIAIGWGAGFAPGVAVGTATRKKAIKNRIDHAIRDNAISIASSSGQALSGEEPLDLLDKEYKKG